MEALLEKIGLTKNESRIYLALLEIGQTTTGNIISKTKIHNSKVYDGLNRLIDKGLASYVHKNNVKYFRAVEPDRILDYLNEKKNQIDRDKEEVEQLLPQFYEKMSEASSSAKAEIFVGWKGMDSIYRKMLNTLEKGDENLVFGASKGEDEDKVRFFFNRHLYRLKRIGVKQRIIFNEYARGNLEAYDKNAKDFKQRFMTNLTPSEINIWGDHVMIVLLKKEPLVIDIEDKDTSDSFREYFEIMWKVAKE